MGVGQAMANLVSTLQNTNVTFISAGLFIANWEVIGLLDSGQDRSHCWKHLLPGFLWSNIHYKEKGVCYPPPRVGRSVLDANKRIKWSNWVCICTQSALICKAVEGGEGGEKGRKKKKRKKSTRSEGNLQRRPEFRTMSFPAVSDFFLLCPPKGSGRIRDLILALFTLGTIGDVWIIMPPSDHD